MRLLPFLLVVFLFTGCATSLEPQLVQEWNKVDTAMGLLGVWSGDAPNGDKVTYVFKEDLTCLWVINDKEVPCKFRGRRHEDGIRLVIYEMKGEQFKDVQFLAWLKVKENNMMIFGYPTKYGRLQTGERAEWPDAFNDQALLLKYQKNT